MYLQSTIKMSKLVFRSPERDAVGHPSSALDIRRDDRGFPRPAHESSVDGIMDSGTLACETTEEREPILLRMDRVASVYYHGDIRNIAIPAGPIGWWDEKRVAILRAVLRDSIPRCILDSICMPFLIWPRPRGYDVRTLGQTPKIHEKRVRVTQGRPTYAHQRIT